MAKITALLVWPSIIKLAIYSVCHKLWKKEKPSASQIINVLIHWTFAEMSSIYGESIQLIDTKLFFVIQNWTIWDIVF